MISEPFQTQSNNIRRAGISCFIPPPSFGSALVVAQLMARLHCVSVRFELQIQLLGQASVRQPNHSNKLLEYFYYLISGPTHTTRL